jgi:hypothetical protein
MSLKPHSFEIFWTPTDANFQHEYNSHIFVENKLEMRAAKIL